MGELEVVMTCPLGSKCEEIKDNKIHRCMWYQKFVGTDAQGKDHDEWGCAIVWGNIIQLETASTNRSVATSIQFLNSAQGKRQKEAIDAIKENDNARIT